MKYYRTTLFCIPGGGIGPLKWVTANWEPECVDQYPYSVISHLYSKLLSVTGTPYGDWGMSCELIDA